jgi:hypothetical protein
MKRLLNWFLGSGETKQARRNSALVRISTGLFVVIAAIFALVAFLLLKSGAIHR